MLLLLEGASEEDSTHAREEPRQDVDALEEGEDERGGGRGAEGQEEPEHVPEPDFRGPVLVEGVRLAAAIRPEVLDEDCRVPRGSRARRASRRRPARQREDSTPSSRAASYLAASVAMEKFFASSPRCGAKTAA